MVDLTRGDLPEELPEQTLPSILGRDLGPGMLGGRMLELLEELAEVIEADILCGQNARPARFRTHLQGLLPSSPLPPTHVVRYYGGLHHCYVDRWRDA